MLFAHGAENKTYGDIILSWKRWKMIISCEKTLNELRHVKEFARLEEFNVNFISIRISRQRCCASMTEKT